MIRSFYLRRLVILISGGAAPAPSYSATITPPAGTLYQFYDLTFTATTDVPSPVYAWSVGAGGTIISGQGTASVVVRFATAGTRSVSLDVTGGATASASWSGTIAAFTPTVIGGLSVWYDASDASTITLDASNNVEQWNDKSGNGRNLVQGAVLNKPGWSAADGVAFTGAAHQLTNSTSVNIVANMTAFVAFRCTNVAGYATTAGADTFANHGGWQIQTVASGTWGRFGTTKTSVGGRVFTAITQIKTTDRIFRVAASATDIRARVTGATIQEATAAAMTGGSGGTTTVGAFPRGNMVVREIAVFSAALTDDEIRIVESYLSARWTT